MNRLLILLFIFCQPAHAALVEYEFTVGSWAPSPSPREPGDELFGRLWFDDAARMTSLLEYSDLVLDGEGRNDSFETATYDASGMSLWVQSGEEVFWLTGTELTIQNRIARAFEEEFWILYLEDETGASAKFNFHTDYPLHDPLQHAALAAPIFADWLRDPTFALWKPDSAGNPVSGRLMSFEPTSVPEPGTFTLLGAGLLVLAGTWRRRITPAT